MVESREIATAIEVAMRPLRDVPIERLRRLAKDMATRIIRGLEIDDDQAQFVLGGVTQQSLESGAFEVTDGLLIRLSIIDGILTRLDEQFQDDRSVSEWLRKKNAFLGYAVPLEMLLTGKLADIVEIRRYFETRSYHSQRPQSKETAID